MSTVTMPVYLPSDVLAALGDATGNFWSHTWLMEPIICEAIHAYIKPVPATQQQPAAPAEAGYQWKQLFLPAGTRLRACFGGQPDFATVEGAEIKYGEETMSPSRFANLHGSGNRNAWRAIWLRLPGSDQWLLADVCRAARKLAIARLLGGEAQDGSQLSSTASKPPQNKDKGTQPATRRTSNRKEDDERARASRQPAARQSGPHPVGARPAGAQAAAPSNGTQKKNGSGRGARRKHRAAKRAAANP